MSAEVIGSAGKVAGSKRWISRNAFPRPGSVRNVSGAPPCGVPSVISP